ncbi:replication-relaxation family protein [Streptomyces sp. NPDC006265]|uniref:replication-relaxation family protein n=1 Tax=Streptomyces sp. NPDC006265 TaxID=3156740 RepID=UPI0033A67AD7
MEKRPELYQQPRSTSLRIGEVDHAILSAVNRHQYLTAAQVGRLLYPDARDENRYVQRRLRRLTEAGYLLKTSRAPLSPLRISTPRLHAGRQGTSLPGRARR